MRQQLKEWHSIDLADASLSRVECSLVIVFNSLVRKRMNIESSGGRGKGRLRMTRLDIVKLSKSGTMSVV